MIELNQQKPGAGCCPKSRGRNAAVTRQAILDAARRCFAHEAYDQVGVREIASIAGIDPSLVNRYFGSKEGLFAEVVGAKFDLSYLFAGEQATLGDRLVRLILNKTPKGDGHDPLVMLLRSSSCDVGREKMRDAILAGFVTPLSARLSGTNTRERAELVGSILMGILVYRTIAGEAAGQDIERQAAVAAPAVQRLIDGE